MNMKKLEKKPDNELTAVSHSIQQQFNDLLYHSLVTL